MYIGEPKRETRVASSCAVLVCGGGIAGIAAAVAAARGGADVTLLEREYSLGGMATLGLVTIYLPLCDGEGRQVVFGLGEELLKLSVKHGAEANYPAAWLDGGTAEERRASRYLTQFNPHLFALAAEDLLLSLGVRILYGTTAVSVRRDGARVTHVICENKSGRSAVACRSVIDCTGDADVAALAGVPTELHRGGNGLASWYYYFTGGKNALKMFGLADVVPGADAAKAKKDGEVYEAVMTESLDRSFRFSGVDGAELSDAVLRAHRLMYADILEQKSRAPDFVPVTTSSVPLVRMSRRIAGAATADEVSGAYAPDSVGMTGDWRRRGPVFELPFGALYSPEVTNLLAAGRCISVTDAMWDVTRVIPPCAVTGEAAGTAAALTDDFPSLDVQGLQRRLAQNGVKLHTGQLTVDN
ncbi:MAG: FAD-dependent oxidoreductase [Oscillospiraceae bacterium]|jgi:hypothetical protein|nr:FAD-dependent oxidoreductase [Oscillospiraceae bacterium]